MIAIGRPTTNRWRSHRPFDRQLLTEDADLLLLRQRERDVLDTSRRHGLYVHRARAAADPIQQIRRLPELALDRRPTDERVVHRQHADGGRVAGETALRTICSSE